MAIIIDGIVLLVSDTRQGNDGDDVKIIMSYASQHCAVFSSFLFAPNEDLVFRLNSCWRLINKTKNKHKKRNKPI